MDKLGFRIKKYRKKNKISLKELAEKVGLSASFLSQIESEKTYPSLQSLKKIADALQTTIGNLIGETETKKNNMVIKSKDRRIINHLGKGIEVQLLATLDKDHI